MKIRINSTKRKKINREKIEITVQKGNPRTVSATFHFDENDFPKRAKIILEAMCAGSEVVQRFDFGTVGNIKPPVKNQLDEIEGDHVFFTVKVIKQRRETTADGETTDEVGLLLGIAENLHPLSGDDGELEMEQKGILPTETKADLGNILWKLEFRDDAVYLLVNKELPEVADGFRNNPLFAALVYPAVIREILFRVVQENVNEDEDEKQWIKNWKRFAKTYNSDELPSKDDNNDDDEIRNWIEIIVDEFCKKFQLKETVKQKLEIL
ncbi:MAG: hypothetical protein LBC02_11705 [Planctomycetaceae bacterium]|nr:hypothetical protein [Planctomycetaceae bacterium]